MENKIRPTDIISGATYLNFLSKYKEYDARQKERLQQLIKENQQYKQQIKKLETKCENLKNVNMNLRQQLAGCRIILKSKSE